MNDCPKCRRSASEGHSPTCPLRNEHRELPGVEGKIGWTIDGNVATFGPTGRTLTVIGDSLCIRDPTADLCEYESVAVLMALFASVAKPARIEAAQANARVRNEAAKAIAREYQERIARASVQTLCTPITALQPPLCGRRSYVFSEYVVGEVAMMARYELLARRNLGETSVAMIASSLAELDLTLAPAGFHPPLEVGAFGYWEDDQRYRERLLDMRPDLADHFKVDV